MKCPIDQSDLVMTERQGIEIDYCPQCRGVWLDRGELDKIIERSNREVSAAPQPQSGNAYPKAQRDCADRGFGGSGNRHGRRGFLGDLFD